MEVDWGGKIGANLTSESMFSEVDWGAHETHTSGCMLSEVDWGAHDSSFSFTWSTLNMMEIQKTSSPKDYAEVYHKENHPPISWST